MEKSFREELLSMDPIKPTLAKATSQPTGGPSNWTIEVPLIQCKEDDDEEEESISLDMDIIKNYNMN